MTAEVAVLNKGAVALAADSAVTITGDGSAKIYNSVNKIFELHQELPIAMLVYGSLEFMGIPVETIIKQYRKDKSNKIFKTISECMDDFTKYLEDDDRYNKEEFQIINVARLLTVLFRDLRDKIFSRTQQLIIQSPTEVKRSLRTSVRECTRELFDELGEVKTAECYSKIKEFDLFEKYRNVHDEVIEHIFAGLPKTRQTLEKLERISQRILSRERLSDNRTGIVIAGFGEEELCPSLRSIEIDGIIGGKLKIKRETDIDIGRNTLGADIIPFAQREMVERFLRGVDPVFDEYVEETLGGYLRKFGEDLIEKYHQGTDAQKTSEKRNLEDVVKKVLGDYGNDSDSFKEREFAAGVKDMVRFMPYEELANLAESLINITSLKRRVSAEQETVGGPIDVALISKAEGFVWIKRKHYFDKEINPRFFTRQSHSIRSS